MTDSPAKTTVLHDWHLRNNANMAIFGGYDMPLWYPSGVKREHRSVITAAGLFDTCHMAVITVNGTNAFNLLQRCFTRDLTACIGKDRRPLSPGYCVYGAYLDDHGHVIDDAIIYQFAEERYMTAVNAGMGGTVAAHLLRNCTWDDVTISDQTDKVGKMDLQGPRSAAILSKILAAPESVFASLPYFSFKGHFAPGTVSAAEQPVLLKDGTPILLSRTGYTGEFGFELFMDVTKTLAVWEQIIDAGSDDGLVVCGLAARDSLRAGAKLPLSHQDIGHWPFINHPWPFALPYDAEGTGFTKDFIGKDALLSVTSPEYTVPFAGFDLRKVSTHEPAATVSDEAGAPLGIVLTCTTDMAIGREQGAIVSIASPGYTEGFDPRGLSCGFLRVTKPLAAGTVVTLSDGRRTIPVEIVDDIRPHRTARIPLKEML